MANRLGLGQDMGVGAGVRDIVRPVRRTLASHTQVLLAVGVIRMLTWQPDTRPP